MGARGNDLTPYQNQLINVKSEGKSGCEMGKITGINRFTVRNLLRDVQREDTKNRNRIVRRRK